MVRVDDGGDVTKCWLDQEELSRLERVAGRDDWMREVAIQLMGRCGLRAHEVPYPADEHLRWSEEGECWLFEVRGKNTSGGDRKLRDAWMPDRVAEDLNKYTRERDLGRGDPWVPRSTPTVRRWVDTATDDIADQLGDDRWRSVTSHDLRRSWATHHLVEEGRDVRTMMSIGGWSDYSAIEPYLKEATEARIGEVMGGPEAL
ncbi:site-specific integrase [Haloglomus litoreum]|uniref:site-specific integrase n=1 Tax=Haloglomus litoreum TaxID=3034026 RepID=UPI0023E84A98|nr:site-specific integrase [Haloglomus sp. DT116]